jgi:hypothetical protein
VHKHAVYHQTIFGHPDPDHKEGSAMAVAVVASGHRAEHSRGNVPEWESGPVLVQILQVPVDCVPDHVSSTVMKENTAMATVDGAPVATVGGAPASAIEHSLGKWEADVVVGMKPWVCSP